ncbi:MAG: carboxypeptidase-like regulatory domain-containing protein, partial [Candidatus Cloacimonetes bacterium]|nr:carboxypeptidase-like regulatory domain-containing protein [Candidatus Cloacimonadota bacterium]
ALNGRVFAIGLGTPLAGATVTLEGPDSHTAITTATGSYSFTEVIANSNYTMKVEKDNYITHTETIQSTFVDKIMPIITLQEITNAPSNVLVNAGRLDAEITWTSPDNSEPDLMMRSRATRALLNYDIWRVTEDDIENEDAWIVIARAVVGNTYIDTNWRGVELGNYAYIIKAKYSGGIVSDYAVSNTVERDVIYNSISGFVLASGTEDGLAGATVTLTGIETYTTTTSATGEYLFAEVIANNNYTLKIEKDNYITHTEDIVTVYDDIEIEDLILQEITNAPINVMATTGRLDAAISWSAPNNSEPALLASRGTRALISYDIWRAADGSDEDDWVELATGLTVTQYTDEDWRFVEPGDYIYIVRANYSGNVVSENAVSNTVERGIIYNSISGLVLASGTDEGLAGATIKLTGIATYTTTSSATGAYSFGHVIANNNYTLTIEKDHYIVHIETVDLAFDDLILPTITLEEITNSPTNVIASANRLDTEISWTAPNNSEPALLASRGTRALINYDIWRAADGSDEGDWVELATGLTVTQYTDEDWRFVEPGDYIYIVRANYSGNVVSENAVSNIVERDVIYNSINGLVLASGTGDGLAGAIITLTGIETYTTTSSATGAYSFGQVRANNNYTLIIEKDNYITHTGEIAIAFADIVIPTITINEITNAPTDVIANAGRLNVAISWTAPNNSSPDLIRQNGSRALLSYDIWRAIAGDTDDWTVIATNLTTTSFTDTNWRYAEPGNYVYMVRANYSGGAVSENAVSNIVERDVIYNSISGFVLESGENIGLAGATITLTGIETYTTTSSATGAYSFEQVIANNNYTLTIAKDNYTTYSVEIMTVFADIVIPTITLEEITNAPTDVIANAGRLDTEIT